MAFLRTPHWTFHLGPPRTLAVPVPLPAANIFQQLLASIQVFSLGSSHPQAEALLGRTCLKRPRLAFLMPRVHIPLTAPPPPRGEGASSLFVLSGLLLCHLRPLQPPSHTWLLRQMSRTNPQTLEAQIKPARCSLPSRCCL